MCKYNNTCIIHFPTFRLCYEMLLVLNKSRKMNLFHDLEIYRTRILLNSRNKILIMKLKFENWISSCAKQFFALHSEIKINLKKKKIIVT